MSLRERPPLLRMRYEYRRGRLRLVSARVGRRVRDGVCSTRCVVSRPFRTQIETSIERIDRRSLNVVVRIAIPETIIGLTVGDGREHDRRRTGTARIGRDHRSVDPHKTMIGRP